MRRPSTRLAALALVVGLLALGAPVAAAETQLDAHGWWWRAQTGAAELPPPPWVPEDGLAVANDADGPSAIAGVRYDIEGEDVTSATLTLDVANEQGGEVAAIRACRARAKWRGAQAGTWAHRPSADCEAGEASGERAEEGERWTFDVSLLVTDGVLNVILLPEAEIEEPDNEQAPPTPGLPEPPGGDESGATFQVAFEPPDDTSLEASGFGGDGFGADDFEVDATADEGAAPTASGEGPREASPPGAEDATGFQPGTRADPGPGGERRSSPSGVAAPETAPRRSQEETAPVAPSEDTGSAQSPVAARPAGFGDDLGRQAAALIALLAGAAAVAVSRAPSPGAGGLHGLRRSLVVRPEVAERTVAGAAAGTGPPRGLGRFARPREGAPPPL